jgi:hypothetical protein
VGGGEKEMTYFIMGGAMRSGTTILNNILCSAENINPQIAECFFLTNLTRAYAQTKGNFDTFLSCYFDNPKAFQHMVGGWVEEFLDKTRKRYKANHLVLKNPEITPLIPDLHELLRNKAKFIVSVRDPRDTVVSMMKVGERMRQQNIAHQLASLGRNVQVFAQMYNTYYANLFNRLTPELKPHVLFIRYEDVVQKLPEVMEALKDFTGLTFHYDPHSTWQNMDEETFKKGEVDPFAKSFDSGLHRKPLSKEAVGRHAEMLTPEESGIVGQQCSKLMQIFQYA